MELSDAQFKGLIGMMIDASENVLLYWKDPDMEVRQKQDASPLTLADTTTNLMICQFLQSISDIPVISEEGESRPEYAFRQKHAWVWLVDPLDGTKEFVKGGDDFTVNVGLVHDGGPVFGMVSRPVTRELYLGWVADDKLVMGIELKCGAYRLKWDPGMDSGTMLQKLEPIHVRGHHPIRIVASKSHMNAETERFLKMFPDKSLVNMGSSLKIIAVAEGKADLYPRLGPTSEWDTCAAHAILSAAGGKLMSLELVEGGYELKPCLYNKETLLNPWFLAFGTVKPF